MTEETRAPRPCDRELQRKLAQIKHDMRDILLAVEPVMAPKAVEVCLLALAVAEAGDPDSARHAHLRIAVAALLGADLLVTCSLLEDVYIEGTGADEQLVVVIRPGTSTTKERLRGRIRQLLDAPCLEGFASVRMEYLR